MKAGFVIDGAKELQAKLESLDRKLQKRVVRDAVRKAQKPMLQQARSRARSVVGGSMGAMLARALVIAAPKRQRRGSYSLHVQILSASRDARRQKQIGVTGFVHVSRTGRQTYIPAAIEFGHGSSKEAAARPYMRPAARATQKETLRIVAQEMANGILREAIKSRYA